MKHLLKSLTLAIVGAFVLNSCDDIPEPYPIPVTEGDVIEEEIKPEGSGTQNSPYNVTKLWELIDQNQAPTGDIYIKGKVSKIKSLDVAQYPRAQYYISDNGKLLNHFYVYNGLYLNGANFTSDDQLKVGDEVVILGKLTTHDDEYQVDQNSKIISINGNTSGDTPTPTPDPTGLTGDGSKDKPYTVTDVTTIYAATPSKAGVWIKGFIVGYVTGQKLAEGATFSADANASVSNILLAESADETDYNKCLVIQLPANSDVRTRINLKDNAANLKQEVSLYGDIEKYFGVAGMKNTTKYVIGTETNDNGDDPTPSGDGTAYTLATTVADGTYLIAANKEASTYVMATDLGANKTYGYLPGANATIAENVITTNQATAEWTITAVTGGYTIKDSSGRYLAMKGTFNSFNVYDTESESYIWNISIESDGTATITNVDKSKYIQYSTTHSNYGCYADAQGIKPKLFKK